MMNGDVLILVVCYIGIDLIIILNFFFEKDLKKVFEIVKDEFEKRYN